MVPRQAIDATVVRNNQAKKASIRLETRLSPNAQWTMVESYSFIEDNI